MSSHLSGGRRKRHLWAIPILLIELIALAGFVYVRGYGDPFPAIEGLDLAAEAAPAAGEADPDTAAADTASEEAASDTEVVVPDVQTDTSAEPAATEEIEEDATEEIDKEDQPYPVIELDEDNQMYSAVFRSGSAAFELYGYNGAAEAIYTEAVNTVADALEGISTVYCMPIPTSEGVTLPDAMMDDASSLLGDQEEACENIFAQLNDNVVAVPVWDKLMHHRDEYIYFRTDHHWTQLGAYYAYAKFCEIKGIEPTPLDDPITEYDGFMGSFYADTDYNSRLGDEPDTVYIYAPRSESATMTITMNDGTVIEDMSVIYDETDGAAGNKYGAFLCGDNQFTVITNPEVTDGSSCILIKESFGNPLACLLADSYSTVYVIDYRYWSGSITSLAKEYGVDDVIFANNLSALRANVRVAEIYSII